MIWLVSGSTERILVLFGVCRGCVEVLDVRKPMNNHLEIKVTHCWPNRLIGDKQAPEAHVRTLQGPSGFLGGKEYKTGCYMFTAD